MNLAPPRVYTIADWHALGEVSLSEGVRLMARSGVKWIQVRAKAVPGAELERELDAIFSTDLGDGISLWMDDRADLACVYPFAGVHMGQEDLPPEPTRRATGQGIGIGLSTHNLRQVEDADESPLVDVVAVGPVFPTTGKANPDPVVGLELLRRARAASSKPLVAIGGVTPDRVVDVLSAGADTVAVLGAACRGNIEDNCRCLLEAAS